MQWLCERLCFLLPSFSLLSIHLPCPHHDVYTNNSDTRRYAIETFERMTH
jgi:hypothetical protein